MNFLNCLIISHHLFSYINRKQINKNKITNCLKIEQYFCLVSTSMERHLTYYLHLSPQILDLY